MECTAIILTLNEAEHIVGCIESLSWADRILVWDSYSRDGTVALAQAAGADIGLSKFENYAQQRNAALDAVQTDWVFFVDADERSTPELAQEIREKIEKEAEAAWEVPRHNYIFQTLTLGAGWFPDYQLRLLKHGAVRYEKPVHETAIVEGRVGQLSQPLIHYNYKDVAHFHAKQVKYSRYDAGILHEEGVIPKWYTPFTQMGRHFYWRFVTLNGWRDGLHGFRLSMLMAYYELQTYRQLQMILREATD